MLTTYMGTPIGVQQQLNVLKKMAKSRIFYFTEVLEMSSLFDWLFW